MLYLFACHDWFQSIVMKFSVQKSAQHIFVSIHVSSSKQVAKESIGPLSGSAVGKKLRLNFLIPKVTHDGALSVK